MNSISDAQCQESVCLAWLRACMTLQTYANVTALIMLRCAVLLSGQEETQRGLQQGASSHL